MLDVYLYCVGNVLYQSVSLRLEKHFYIHASLGISRWSSLARVCSADQGLSNGIPHEFIPIFLARL
jgi:uncharacterized membrane protein YczE